MNPLNTFPILLNYILFVPLILRVIIGIFLLSLAKEAIKKENYFLAFLDFVVGVTLILGFYTQISAILGIILVKLDFYFTYWVHRKTTHIHHTIYQLYTLSIFVLLSLIISGAGFLALDMPF